MSELSVYPLEEIIQELKTRNLSFLIAWVDHQQFTKDRSFSNDIVWGLDSSGNLVLQEVLIRFLNSWHDQIVKNRTVPEN